MPYNLPCRLSVVAENIIGLGIHSRDNSIGDLSNTTTHSSQNFSRTLMQLPIMSPWDHQRVPVADRSDIEKSKYRVVGIYLNTRDISAGNSTEYAIVTAH